MAKKNNLIWEAEPPENFLDEHSLYRGVHKNLWMRWSDLSVIYPNFFQFDHTIGGLSVDWSKYATSEFTFNRLTPDLKIFGIVEFIVGKLRECIRRNNFPITIQHDPKTDNRAHSLLKRIHEVNKAKVKIELSRIAQWAPNMKPFKY